MNAVMYLCKNNGRHYTQYFDEIFSTAIATATDCSSVIICLKRSCLDSADKARIREDIADVLELYSKELQRDVKNVFVTFTIPRKPRKNTTYIVGCMSPLFYDSSTFKHLIQSCRDTRDYRVIVVIDSPNVIPPSITFDRVITLT